REGRAVVDRGVLEYRPARPAHVARRWDLEPLPEGVDHRDAVHPGHVAVAERERDDEPVRPEGERELDEREPGEVGRVSLHPTEEDPRVLEGPQPLAWHARVAH